MSSHPTAASSSTCPVQPYHHLQPSNMTVIHGSAILASLTRLDSSKDASLYFLNFYLTLCHLRRFQELENGVALESGLRRYAITGTLGTCEGDNCRFGRRHNECNECNGSHRAKDRSECYAAFNSRCEWGMPALCRPLPYSYPLTNISSFRFALPDWFSPICPKSSESSYFLLLVDS